jgi:hypothetical protein
MNYLDSLRLAHQLNQQVHIQSTTHSNNSSSANNNKNGGGWAGAVGPAATGLRGSTSAIPNYGSAVSHAKYSAAASSVIPNSTRSTSHRALLGGTSSVPNKKSGKQNSWGGATIMSSSTLVSQSGPTSVASHAAREGPQMSTATKFMAKTKANERKQQQQQQQSLTGGKKKAKQKQEKNELRALAFGK